MKLLGRTKIKITKNRNCGNLSLLGIIEVVEVQCNIVKNDYQRDSRVLSTFVSNKTFGQSSDYSSKKFIFSKMFISEFPYTEALFTDPDFKPLEIRDEINMTLAIN